VLGLQEQRTGEIPCGGDIAALTKWIDLQLPLLTGIC
jgi:hypothetical protein